MWGARDAIWRLAVAAGLALASGPGATQDRRAEYARWIERLGRSEETYYKVVRAPKDIDPLLWRHLRAVSNSRRRFDRTHLHYLIEAMLRRRYVDKAPLTRSQFEAALAASAWSGNARDLLTQGGAPVYRWLLQAAKRPRRSPPTAAAYWLRIATQSIWSQGKPADPALVRLWRRERQWDMLALLGDRASLPAMRRAAVSTSEESRLRAWTGLAMLQDQVVATKIIPYLASPREIEDGRQDGKFGKAARVLRNLLSAEQSLELIRFIRRHEGLPRAFAINVFGVRAPYGRAVDIEPYLSDPLPRVREATRNAIRKLPSGYRIVRDPKLIWRDVR